MAAKPCEKCKGTGTEPRQDSEANADLHPFLSKTEGLCWHCGGSRVEPEKPRAIVRQEASQIAGLIIGVFKPSRPHDYVNLPQQWGWAFKNPKAIWGRFPG